MTDQHVIHVLSDEVINKIAAGEVVERPASVLKELVENSVDAGAKKISVEIVAGGSKLISVADDGGGMSRDSALLAIERHATSKICDVTDIERVNTFGFRGEALAAIASVSRFSLVTRPRGELGGTEVQISGGRVLSVNAAGCPEGTQISVRQLFYNVPARRKFMRSEVTELTHLRHIFYLYALSCPEIAFHLSIDENSIYQLPSGMQLIERLRALFDPQWIVALRPVACETPTIKVSGYVGLPRLHRSDRSAQYLFINRRPVSSPTLMQAVRQGYSSLLPREKHPVIFLFLEIDPTTIDVNVHPTKKEVRFRRPDEVRRAVMQAISRALEQSGEHRVVTPSLFAPRYSEAPVVDGGYSGRPTMTPEQLLIAPIGKPTISRPTLPIGESRGIFAATQNEPSAELVATQQSNSWGKCRVLGQVNDFFVILEAEDGMVIMDPHAAHERVLYERFLKEPGACLSQKLLTPESIILPPMGALALRNNIEMLQKTGFGIAEFGTDTFIIDALPSCLGNVSPAEIISEIAGASEETGTQGRWNEELVARLACHAAVKAHDRLSLGEINQLVADLANTEMPYTCPHGRPTLIFMGFDELRRKFLRI